jgi:hypothetical protein
MGGATGVGGAFIEGGDSGFAGESGSAGVGGTGRGGAGMGGTTSVAGSGGTGNVTPISCGDDVCNTPKEKCCLGAGLACVPKGQDCAGAVLTCTLNSDCSGDQVCCISITGEASEASACKPSCDFGGGTRDRQLCDTAADCRMPFRYCTPTVFGVNICTRRP